MLAKLFLAVALPVALITSTCHERGGATCKQTDTSFSRSQKQSTGDGAEKQQHQPEAAKKPKRQNSVEQSLRRLISLHKKIGKFDLIENLYQARPENAMEINREVGSTKKKIARSRKRVTRAAKEIFNDTEKRLKAELGTRLHELAEASENAGSLHEQLRLYDKPQVKASIKITKKELECLVNEADEEVDLILKQLIKQLKPARSEKEPAAPPSKHRTE